MKTKLRLKDSNLNWWIRRGGKKVLSNFMHAMESTWNWGSVPVLIQNEEFVFFLPNLMAVHVSLISELVQVN